MSEVRIAAEPRTEFGKGAARRVRRADKVPAVLYGHGTAPRHVSLPGHELMLALKGGSNVLLRLALQEGEDELALPRAVTRDPIKGNLEHLDLLLVRQGERVAVDVAVALTGEAQSETIVDQQHTTLHVDSDATAIPAGFEVSIDGLGVGDHVTAGQVALPAGVTLLTDPEAVVVQGLAAPTAPELEEVVEEGEEELQVGADEPAGEGDVVPETDES